MLRVILWVVCVDLVVLPLCAPACVFGLPLLGFVALVYCGGLGWFVRLLRWVLLWVVVVYCLVLVGVYLIWWDGALRVVLIWLVGLVLLVWFGCVALM